MQEADEQGRSSFLLRSKLTHHPTRYMSDMQCASRAWSTSFPSVQMFWHYTLHSSGLVSLFTLIWNSRSSGFSSLTTWLAHSKKKNCDVCKYPYLFTKGVLLLRMYFRDLLKHFISVCAWYAIDTSPFPPYQTVCAAHFSGNIVCTPGYGCGYDMVRRSTSGSSVDLENVFLNGRVDVRLLFKRGFL